MIYLRRFVLLYPLVFIVAVYASWLAARVVLGRWPVPSVDDPGGIGGVFSILEIFLTVLFFGLLPYVGILSLLLTQAVLDAQKRMMLLRDCALSFLFIAGFFLLARLDPGGVFSWLGD